MDNSVFVVTNRDFRRVRDERGYELRDGLNKKGARELRLFEATPRDTAGEQWHFALVEDNPAASKFKGLDTPFLKELDERKLFGSDLVAARLLNRLRDRKRHLGFFIHGYNNNAEDAVRRAFRLANRYEVEVVVFSWPANGGGDRLLEGLHGKASYKSDKSEARASTEALDRALSRMHGIIQDINAGVYESVESRIDAQLEGAQGEDRRRLIAEGLRQRVCPFNVTLLAHSMGNYLYKKMLLSSEDRLSTNAVFDNVILKAADVNHERHGDWVSRIRSRRRIYVLLNQNDAALQLSTMKLGELQKARLGNTLARQDAPGATYLDLTGYLGDEHSYFDRVDLKRRNARELEAFFRTAFHGEIAERDLPYFTDTNTYRLT